VIAAVGGVMLGIGGFVVGTSSGQAGANAIVPAASRAQLRAFACQRALDPPARAISVTAVMRPVAGTRHLQMSFALTQRAPGATAWTSVIGPHLGAWISPTGSPPLGQRPGDVWKVPFPVAGLAGPATYRFQVSFRWLGQRNAVLASTTRVTQNCWQPERRPDLTVSSVGIRKNQTRPGFDVFSVLVHNVGATAAREFAVQLSYQHNQQPVTKSNVVASLKGHTATTVVFGGPICEQATNVTATADPAHAVDVYSRSNAALSVTCPLPAVAGTP
jgi:hypothetical protein